MNWRQIMFNNAKWVDSSIGAFVVFIILGALLNVGVPQKISTISVAGYWFLIFMFSLVVFFYLFKRDILKSTIRQEAIRNKDKVFVRVSGKSYKGIAIILSDDEIKKYLRDYTELRSKWSRKPLKPTIAVDVGDRKYIICSLVGKIKLLAN